MKRIVAGLLAGAALLSASLLFAQQGSVGVSPMPSVIQAPDSAVNADVYYGPTSWPLFSNCQTDNPTCGAWLINTLGGTNINGAPAAQAVMSMPVNIPSAYLTTANLLVTWTLRVVAFQWKSAVNSVTGASLDNGLSTVNAWRTDHNGNNLSSCNGQCLCTWWHGTIDETFPGGNITSYLYVNGQNLGQAAMTFPSLGSGSNTNVSDPTITGSVALTPATFGGTYPVDASGNLTLQLMWVNSTTGSGVVAPAYMRTMTVFVDPLPNNQ
jgi:hypothetical protein